MNPQGVLFSDLAYAHSRKLTLKVHTEFGCFYGTVNSINTDAISLASDPTPIPAMTTIALSAIKVIEWCDVAVVQPSAFNEAASETEPATT